MKIGLFGGTFNPVHRAHLLLARGAQAHLGLDRVVWIPAHLPPHKGLEGHVGSEDRARMVELAIHGVAGFELSRIELDRPPPSYTIDTVCALQASMPDSGVEWCFLLGSESARQLPTWRQIDELRKRIRFYAVPRPGDSSSDPLPFGVPRIPVRTLDVSSSEIRRRVREGLSIEDWVPGPVRRYIEEKGLYRTTGGAG